jgi:hypothetical protein
LAGCAESTAEVNAPEVWETKAADPAFARRAEAALRTAPPPAPGWRVGVVVAEQNEDGWSVNVLTRDGYAVITNSWSYDCEDRFGIDVFPLMLDPGDLITWAGDGRLKHAACVEDLRLLRKTVA